MERGMLEKMKTHGKETIKESEMKSICCSAGWTLVVGWNGEKWVEILKCRSCGKNCEIK